ncbi:hypothetical protein LZ480_01325 [Solibacillus sp. MA9]|uniref:Uncharacterized protein n=1 Tax=Solibacillus palustris TaxID=2908203 RepID=A0ABS9U852_9BACL|nr:hypothetical protein [Solibacillus sp. MA9]MCH7320512.1 hypothetical protein [Solibacillus sp. MA9]
MKIDIWIGMIISAILSFAIAAFFGEPLNWYLLVLLIVTGLYINTIIIILKLKDDRT